MNVNNDLAISFARLHHLAIIALNPETDPVTLERSIIRIATESEALAHQFSDNSEAMNQKLWAELFFVVEKDLEVEA